MSTQVTTQAELDAALAADDQDIEIRSPRGAQIVLSATGSATVSAYGSATVSATGSATVFANDSATVSAYDTAMVTAYGSATVSAYGSAMVTATGSATVRAYDTATVTATKHVAVHLHSADATTSGGVTIDIAGIDLNDPRTWFDYHGCEVTAGGGVVYKAVSPELTAGQWRIPTTYVVGTEVVATDWAATRECGHGLHFGYTPDVALAYYQGREPREQVRFLACEIDVYTAVPLGDKIKAPSCRVLREVDLMGREVTTATMAAGKYGSDYAAVVGGAA